MNVYAKIIAVLMGVMFTLNLSLFAQKGLGDTTGVARSGEQPPIVKLEGVLDQIKTGSCEHTTGNSVIGTHLLLYSETGDPLLNIHLGAAYAVEPYVQELVTGQMVEVEAFQTEAMESFEYIAIKVSSNGYTFQLRDENLRPFWAGDQKLWNGKP